jgi:Gram-negative bacterial TonB protein C-terminal
VRTLTIVAGAVLLGTATLGLPGRAGSEPADAVQNATPCPFTVVATSVPGDPSVVVVRLSRSAVEPGGTVTAYGATTRWSGTVDRFAGVTWDRSRRESSVLARAPGPIEAIVYQPPHSDCLAHAGVRPRNGYDGPEIQRPTVALANPQSIEPVACPQRYAAPKTLHAAEPRTPEIAMQQNIGGIVDVVVTLDDRGQPTNAVVENSPSAILNYASTAAALHSTYSPEIFRCRTVRGAYVFSVSYGVSR